MNREIKFRIWDIDNKRYLSEFAGANKTRVEEFSIESLGYIGWAQTVFRGHRETKRNIGQNFIFQQFTGLLDENGKEIYEGDILSGETKDTIFDNLICQYEIDYGGYSFVYNLGENQDFKYWFKQLTNLEVTGNIFEKNE